MKEASMTRDLTEGNVRSRLIRFALPFMLANLLQTIYTTVDAVIVGQVVGKEALAAVTNCGILVDFYVLFGMGIASAGQVLIAQFVGKKDADAVRKTIGTLFTSEFVVGLIMTVVCIALMDFQLGWLNIPAESLAYGRVYTLTCACGFLMTYGYATVAAVLRGMGDSKRPLIFIAIASCMNLILDLLFVVGFRMEAFGAALATVLGQSFSFVVSIIYLYRHREAFGFDFKPASFRPDPADLRMLARLGGPMALQFSAITVSMVYVHSLVNGYGVAPSAITGVGDKLDAIIRIVNNSMGTAGSAMIAQCMGAGKKERVTKVVRCSLAVCGVYTAACCGAVFFFGRQVFGMFNSEPEVLALVPAYRCALVVNFISFPVRAAYGSVINGIGFASLGLFSCLMDGVVARIGLSVLFGSVMGFGITGFWYGSALAGMVSAAIVSVYYYSGHWKTRRLITQR